MTDEEKELAKGAPPTAAFPQELPPPSDEGRALVKQFVGSAAVAVVAMESCEFCWTAFKLFDALGVSYKTLNFDALEYAPNNQGNVIRACVQEHTGVVTFPQVFIGGDFFGGAADACVKWKKGELQPVLEAAGAKPAGDKEWNGYAGDRSVRVPAQVDVPKPPPLQVRVQGSASSRSSALYLSRTRCTSEQSRPLRYGREAKGRRRVPEAKRRELQTESDNLRIVNRDRRPGAVRVRELRMLGKNLKKS